MHPLIEGLWKVGVEINRKGPCTQIVKTLALKYLFRDYFKAKVYTIWAHGPLGKGQRVKDLESCTSGFGRAVWRFRAFWGLYRGSSEL